MRTRPRSLALTAMAAATALALVACGGGNGANDPGLAPAEQQPQGVNDVNPLPRDQVRDGGDLRWPLDAIPDNFNINHVDGNLLENRFVVDALLPGAFTRQADASVALDEDYFTSVELTAESPQVVTYTINPQASWDDGTPLTWSDLQAQWQALNGTNPAYLPADTAGYDSIASVERGVDDKQAVVTFAEPFAEWRALFEHIYPAATNLDPDAFNTGWLTGIGTTAGPFRTESVDTTAQTITLVRNPNWWGEPAKLDRIIFRVVERSALADALANNEIDFYSIGSDVNLFARAQTIQGVTVRQATEPVYNHITFNGAPGAILSDPALRHALVRGIDRQAIASALIGQIVPDVEPLNQYIYLQGSADYVDHAQDVSFDPAAANAELDALGWVSPGPGQPRTRDGQTLTVRYVETTGNPISERIVGLTAAQLTAIGVNLERVPVASADLFDQYVTPGNFDMIGFAYSGSPFPIVSNRSVFVSGSESNVSRINTPEIDALFQQAATELDDAARTELNQQIDQALWEALPLLPLYQASGAYAVRETLANFGAGGFADDVYTDIGFTG
ncbi:ABC transporter family substrate-binding protein [Pseudonocardia kunmingensis]|uniref:Peptide/nickel transport system substrate-binding protein n=1 Tax=Pseudonocardia kunmingensis TaxID=630975 RepID=A0A543CZ67_9PSEU|nr:ABC transporter family substrate-binding protein [Pseudonocardia kunmingensis]TQM02188.1 peptide/nickel transport system substrate-binding protein [Pseudonocardia kunmingensis]